jgi:hypothetical protein
MILDVWQAKGLLANFADVWQGKELQGDLRLVTGDS